MKIFIPAYEGISGLYTVEEIREGENFYYDNGSMVNIYDNYFIVINNNGIIEYESDEGLYSVFVMCSDEEIKFLEQFTDIGSKKILERMLERRMYYANLKKSVDGKTCPVCGKKLSASNIDAGIRNLFCNNCKHSETICID